ncbi:MAG: hypothetical protein IAF38_08075 [Bacteroidia bacterium]|nr:hypothetical protein [Bacteroidia bacterium]
MRTENFIIDGSKGKPITLDVSWFENGVKKPVIIFSHGFKGFKDWGHFNLVAKEFAEAGFVFVKYNFSYNGTTPENLTETLDLDAFGNNNFSLELDDLALVIDFFCRTSTGLSVTKEISDFQNEIDTDQLFLLGHSRGGGITLLKSAEDARVKKAVTWAAISDTYSRMNPPELVDWRRDGVAYVQNFRTGQNLPLYFQFYEDFTKNINRLDLVPVSKKIKIPVLIFHGKKDDSVLWQEAVELNKNIPGSELYMMEEADHTFGGKHPWTENRLPLDTQEIIAKSISFLLK